MTQGLSDTADSMKKNNIIRRLKTVLTIAGSDSSGGAGIQADIKTIAAHDLFGTSVITSITAQNTLGVQSTHDLATDTVEAQLKAVLSDEKPAAVKTGMLGNEAIVECVARQLKRARIKNLVVDPVMRSTDRKVLLSKNGILALQEKLLPLATLVTPNIPEAEILSGIKIKQPGDRLRAARQIMKTGVKSVLIKGGHAKKHSDDFFFDGKRSWEFESVRLRPDGLHGTGCVLSAAVASGLAQGLDLPTAIRHAKGFIRTAISSGILSGKGVGSVDPLAVFHRSRQRFELLQSVSAALEVLKENKIGNLIPEVQSNIGVGLPGAEGVADVVAIPGRIVKRGRDIFTVAQPQFGASRHVAKIVLTVMRFDPSQRAVMNIKFTGSLLKACQRLGFKIGSFSRADEPKSVKQLEGSSLEWGTHQAIRACGFVPDIIYDLGGQGKEEMIRVIASDVGSLLDKILKIHRRNQKDSPPQETDLWRKH